MRILITGVAGHLGSRLAEYLLAHVPGVHISGIDNESSGFRENVPAGVEYYFLDLAGDLDEQIAEQTAECEICHEPFHMRLGRYGSLGDGDYGWVCRKCEGLPMDPPAALFAEPFDYVFHFAAFAAECLSPFVRTYTIDNVWRNTSALISQVLASGGCRRFVFASSIAVYGQSGRAPFRELNVPRPHDPYGMAKLACEHDLRIAGEQHGLDYCILRPHNVYGRGQNLWDRHRNVFGIWMRAALEGQPLVIFGDGQQRRAFTPIDDILPCILHAALEPRASRQVINLGGSQPTSIRAAAQLVAQITSARAIEHVPARHEVRDAWCSTIRSEQLLGYCDQTPLADGLASMWAWAQEAWQRYPERRTRRESFTLELTAGLPAVWAG